MFRRTDCGFESLVIDRGLVSTWVDGSVALMGGDN